MHHTRRVKKNKKHNKSKRHMRGGFTGTSEEIGRLSDLLNYSISNNFVSENTPVLVNGDISSEFKKNVYLRYHPDKGGDAESFKLLSGFINHLHQSSVANITIGQVLKINSTGSYKGENMYDDYASVNDIALYLMNINDSGESEQMLAHFIVQLKTIVVYCLHNKNVDANTIALCELCVSMMERIKALLEKCRTLTDDEKARVVNMLLNEYITSDFLASLRAVNGGNKKRRTFKNKRGQKKRAANTSTKKRGGFMGEMAEGFMGKMGEMVGNQLSTTYTDFENMFGIEGVLMMGVLLMSIVFYMFFTTNDIDYKPKVPRNAEDIIDYNFVVMANVSKSTKSKFENAIENYISEQTSASMEPLINSVAYDIAALSASEKLLLANATEVSGDTPSMTPEELVSELKTRLKANENKGKITPDELADARKKAKDIMSNCMKQYSKEIASKAISKGSEYMMMKKLKSREISNAHKIQEHTSTFVSTIAYFILPMLCYYMQSIVMMTNSMSPAEKTESIMAAYLNATGTLDMWEYLQVMFTYASVMYGVSQVSKMLLPSIISWVPTLVAAVPKGIKMLMPEPNVVEINPNFIGPQVKPPASYRFQVETSGFFSMTNPLNWFAGVGNAFLNFADGVDEKINESGNLIVNVICFGYLSKAVYSLGATGSNILRSRGQTKDDLELWAKQEFSFKLQDLTDEIKSRDFSKFGPPAFGGNAEIIKNTLNTINNQIKTTTALSVAEREKIMGELKLAAHLMDARRLEIEERSATALEKTAESQSSMKESQQQSIKTQRQMAQAVSSTASAIKQMVQPQKETAAATARIAQAQEKTLEMKMQEQDDKINAINASLEGLATPENRLEDLQKEYLENKKKLEEMEKERIVMEDDYNKAKFINMTPDDKLALSNKINEIIRVRTTNYDVRDVKLEEASRQYYTNEYKNPEKRAKIDSDYNTSMSKIKAQIELIKQKLNTIKEDQDIVSRLKKIQEPAKLPSRQTSSEIFEATLPSVPSDYPATNTSSSSFRRDLTPAF